MQATDCSQCHWGSDEPNGLIYCYWSGKMHEQDDCCRNYKEPCRLNPATGQPFDKQEVPGPEVRIK